LPGLVLPSLVLLILQKLLIVLLRHLYLAFKIDVFRAERLVR
jgi:hypothetical protein